MDWRASSETAKNVMDVVIRLTICFVVVAILAWPQLFPFLRHFTVRSGEVNIFGSKFEISQIDGLLPGLTINGDRLQLQGVDISTLPDTIAQLKTDKAELSARLKETEALLADVRKQRDLANQQLANLSKTVPSAKPVATGETDKAITRTEVAAAAPSASAEATPEPAAQSGDGNYDYGIALSADTTKDGAQHEGEQAKKTLSGGPVGYFQREKYIRSVALFPSRADATKALVQLRKIRWKTAYVVDLRTWCPAAAVSIQSAIDSGTVIDCRF